MNHDDDSPKIYLLPNLMTAGNLFCGFASTLKIVEGSLKQIQGEPAINLFEQSIWFILGACIFDLLDGRLARLGGHESPFGREFDSLADIVSFGLAPALLIYRILLPDSPRFEFGWLIAFVYLACGALRLARFNCIAATNSDSVEKDFKGFPIPAAAGVIASITWFLLNMQANDKEIGKWRYVLPVLMLFLSFMMFSRVRYPSFKAINWRTQRSIPKFIVILLLVAVTIMNLHWMPAVLFVAYLLYGFLRPWISKEWRREIEEELGEEGLPDEDDPEPSVGAGEGRKEPRV